MIADYLGDEMVGRIDPEILPLCNLIRTRSGLTTLSSCSGHDDQTPNVSVVADGFQNLKRFVRALSNAEEITNQVHGDGTVIVELGLILSPQVHGCCSWLVNDELHDWIGLDLRLLDTGFEALGWFTDGLEDEFRLDESERK